MADTSGIHYLCSVVATNATAIICRVCNGVGCHILMVLVRKILSIAP